MKWGKKLDKKTGKRIDDKTILIINDSYTIKGVPSKAQEYVINGRTPLEWLIDRYQIKTDKKFGLINNPNEYSENPYYILDLICRLVTVSVRTMEIIDSMMPIAEIAQPIDWPDDWKQQ